MKTLTLVLSIMLINVVLFGQTNCEKFKTGKFKNMENGILKSTFQRDDSIQIEEYGNKKVKLRIAWESECSYRLKFLEANDAWWGSEQRNRKTFDLIVRITEVNENSYVQEAKFEDEAEFEYSSRIEKTD